MFPHHQLALERACERLLENDSIVAILLAGSIARGVERPDSDLDLIVVVTDEHWDQRRKDESLTFLWHDVADYEGGFVEGRYVSQDYVVAASQYGSEPTRHSFTNVTPVYSKDSLISEKVKLIPVYPENQRQYRIDAFMAQMYINKIYFFPEGIRRKDPYLLGRAASEIVLFGCRLILAHNRILFPCQRRLMEYVAAASEKPDKIVEIAHTFLKDLDMPSMIAFTSIIEAFNDWTIMTDLESHFQRDCEMSWFTKTLAISEW